jgi:Putative zinc-finger
MSPRRHLDDLFSAAYEDELSPIDEARFQTHMQSCAPCAAAYAEFRATIEALHGLPRAPMPHVVHLPSTPPVAERSSRPRAGLSWFNLGLLRRFPATAAAGAAAVVLVILALTHANAVPQNGTAVSGSIAQVPAEAHGPAADAACAHSIVSITSAALPSSFGQEDLATDPAQPALHLVLAAPTLVVAAGKPAVLYAQVSVPVTTISNPGSAASPPPARAVLPCVTVGVGSTSQRLAVIPASNGSLGGPYVQGAGTPIAAPGLQFGGGTGPLLTFQVPAGLARGTQLHVVATIPAGYTSPGSPPLTAQLTLTTR